MEQSKLICGDCGAEVKQEGTMLKCQNLECRMQIPIDIDAINDMLAIIDTENATQLPETNE